MVSPSREDGIISRLFPKTSIQDYDRLYGLVYLGVEEKCEKCDYVTGNFRRI